MKFLSVTVVNMVVKIQRAMFTSDHNFCCCIRDQAFHWLGSLLNATAEVLSLSNSFTIPVYILECYIALDKRNVQINIFFFFFLHENSCGYLLEDNA